MSRFITRSGALLVAGSLFLAGCANPIVASVEPTPTAVPTPIPPSQPTFAVTRGSITDVIQATGRVVAVQQQDLYFRIPGNLDNIYVNVQDKVTKGQVLGALDTSTLKKQIARDQAGVEAAKLDLQKAQATMTNSNVGTDQDIKSADAGVLSAQAAYDSANAKLQALTNPTASDVAKAQASIGTAKAGLATAQLKLQALQAGAAPADQQKAAAAIAAAQTNVNVAKEKLAEVQAGPTPTDIALAKAKLQSAQDGFNAAKATYLAFQNGPTAADQQKAQLAVTQAKNALFAAQTSRDAACAKAPAVGQAECNSANAGVNTAQSNLDAAQQTLNQLGAVSATDKMKADASYQQAQADLTAAQASYTAATQAAQPTEIAQAKDAVAQAEAGLQQAQAAQAALAPTANQIALARQDVASAQAGVDAANATLQGVLNTAPQTVRQQSDAVAQAAAAVSQAQNSAAKVRALAGQGNTNTIDLAIYQKKIDQAQLQLAQDNDQLSQMQVVAPFDGIVIATNGQAGDRVNAYTAIVTVANPQTLQIAVSVPQSDLTKVVVGQKATMLLDAFPGKTVTGTVSQLPAVTAASAGSSSPNASTAAPTQPQGTVVDTSPKITPDWPGPGAQLGQLARVTVIVQKKDNVLMIPTNTVNKINNRTFVILDDNGRQKPVDIQIGIQTDTETEVVSGLTVGQKVFTRGL
ncbi:MAG: efflux RND transporter periplasmic adaptor subunit [Chloroflexota bacterium]